MGYLLAGSIIGPGGLKFISEMVQVYHFLSSIFLSAYIFQHAFSHECFAFTEGILRGYPMDFVILWHHCYVNVLEGKVQMSIKIA